MSVRRRWRRATASPTSGRHRWIAMAVVVVVLVGLVVWIGAELSEWPPPPPNANSDSDTQSLSDLRALKKPVDW